MKIEELACQNCGAALSGDFSPGQQIECDNCGSVFLASELEAPKAVACPQCRTLNAISERFCARCGESLKVDCILCHAQNIVGASYCAHCGAHLARARAWRKKLQADRHKLRQERNRLFQEKEARQRAEKLHQLLEDLDEPENHEYAIYQINRIGPEAIDALIETLLNDSDPDARYGSARALGQICVCHDVKSLIKARAAKALIKALDDPETAVRYWSAHALGYCQGQAAIEPLTRTLRDNHKGVREQAEQALRKIGGSRVEKILTDYEKKGLFDWLKGI